MAALETDPPTEKRSLRIAIEGCGHGTLDAIYASIFKGCQAKGWDSVDLVIICGDFQAVRDRRDLNVTAMPAKYREMADFHQYYWGSKKAPFLTVFIGGNHEASNHLWELYYGGWVAPNIYYLGAANVIQFGPLKIASMSGIWKGYDYKKPHHERLPYSDEDMYTIYHVRELDVRKLLAYRSQVDIGLSHDWPRGIEWLGDHRQLFQHKAFLKEDADQGKLGNVAAKNVLDHLRPPYWFSAHLHVRYAAVKTHGDETSGSAPTLSNPDSSNGKRLAAWHNFQTVAQEEEARSTAQHIQEQTSRREEAERTGVPVTSDYRYNETYKRVKLADGFSRTVASVTMSEPSDAASVEEDLATPGQLPQLDGCCISRPAKRHHDPNDAHTPEIGNLNAAYQNINVDGTDMASSSMVTASNPDAIDLDLSDDEESRPTGADLTRQAETEESPLLPDKQNYGDEKMKGRHHSAEAMKQDDRSLQQSNISTRSTLAGKSVIHTYDSVQAPKEPQPEDQPVLVQTAQWKAENVRPSDRDTMTDKEEVSLKNGSDEQGRSEVSEDMRAQLAALSTKFADVNKIETSAPLPHPEAIQNPITKFLALSKCAPGQRFLQLMEIESCRQAAQENRLTPKLRYDPEWLAILRVFSPELALSGNARDAVPTHRGDTYYRDRIFEEEQWIEDNVVNKGLLTVPNNFVNTLKDTNSSDEASMTAMPIEGTNPQTTAFCQLIGIDNKFDMSEADREARRSRGPNQTSNFHRGRGGSAGHQGGRGGRGGHRGRGGRGRGRRH